MPKYYVYYGNDRRGNQICASCKLTSNRCSFTKEDGDRCKNRVLLTQPYCWIHSYELFGVRVKPSLVIPGQKGLFAARANHPNNVAFKKGEFICPYYGNIESADNEFESKPYTMALKNGYEVNADCYRSLASNANSNAGIKPRKDFNATLVDKSSNPANLPGLRNQEDIDLGHLSAPAPGQHEYNWAGLRASKTIKVGEEILVFYGRQGKKDSYLFKDDNVTTGYLKNKQKALDKYCPGHTVDENDEQLEGTVVHPSFCEDGGNGLFANTDWKKGQIVATYKGIVMNEVDAQYEDATYTVNLPGTPNVLIGQPSNEHRGTYINDYRNCGTANVKFVLGASRIIESLQPGQTYTFNVVATRDIEGGEEFLGNYAGGGHFHTVAKGPRERSASSKARDERAAKRGAGISDYTKMKAKKLGVKVVESKQPKKKLDVYRDGEHVASIGQKGMMDYPSYLKLKGKEFAERRRDAYKKRHEAHRHKVNTPSYYADQLLW